MSQDDFSAADDSDSPAADTTTETSLESNLQSPESAEPPSAGEEQDAAVNEPIEDADLDAAKAAWENAQSDSAEQPAISDEDLERAAELAEPFVGRWNLLISTTNWEKGRIVSEWRESLIDSGVDATQYSDEAWSRRVGGVTAPHVGRLRRVYDKFNDSYSSYDGLYWSHFLAALDWEDAPMWLEGATKESWSISEMRENRWQAEGAVDGKRPSDSQIVDVETDEDAPSTEPAQGGGKTREYDNDSGSVASGPTFEGPDFGDEDQLQGLPDLTPGETAAMSADGEGTAQAPVQPFIGLPQLPEDLNEALESLKLSLLRHKATEWRDVDIDTVERYLQAIGVMIRS